MLKVKLLGGGCCCFCWKRAQGSSHTNPISADATAQQAVGGSSVCIFWRRFSFSLELLHALSTERLSLVERRQRCDDAEIFGTNVSVVSRLTTGIEWKLLPPMMLAWEQCCGEGFGICCMHGGYPVSSVPDLGNRFAVLGSWNCTVLNLLYYLCHFLLSRFFFLLSTLVVMHVGDSNCCESGRTLEQEQKLLHIS